MNFLTLQQHSWLGRKPNEQIKESMDKAHFVRYCKTGDRNVTTIEIENIVVEFRPGRLFGEIALLEKDKDKRMLSAMTKTDSALLKINQEAFNLLIKPKLIHEREIKGRFVYNSIPKMNNSFAFQTVLRNVHVIFKDLGFEKGKEILAGREIVGENQKSDCIFLIQSGTCAIYKKVKVREKKNGSTQETERNIKVIELGPGECFGEDMLCFGLPNTYSVVAVTTKVTLHYISYHDFKRFFKRILPQLQKYFFNRKKLMEQLLEKYYNSKKVIRKTFHSIVEKGKINVYLSGEMKQKMTYANP